MLSFSGATDWLKGWRKTCRLITKRNKAKKISIQNEATHPGLFSVARAKINVHGTKENIEKDVFSSCHECGTKKFWVPLRNRTPDLRLSGRASECGIRRSEVRFLAGEFFLCPTLVTTKSVFLYFFTELKNFQSLLFYLEKRTLPQTNYQHAYRVLDLFWTQLKLALSRPRPSCSKGGWRHPTDKLLFSG